MAKAVRSRVGSLRNTLFLGVQLISDLKPAITDLKPAILGHD